MNLYEHQQKALDWANGKSNYALFMEMRTGKSLVAINQVKQWQGKTLLIAPISTWFDWQQILTNCCQSFLLLTGNAKQRLYDLWDNIDNANWFIINPEGLTRLGSEFFNGLVGIDNCILDESVFIKNPKAKITKLLLKHRDMFSHKLIMTGTPIAEQTEDIVTQMIWVYGSFMKCKNFYEWRCRYMHPMKFGWTLNRGVANEIRYQLKQLSFTMSAKEAGMFTDQVKQTSYIELPTKIAKEYKEVERLWKLREESTKYGIVKDIWLAQLAAGIYPSVMDVEPICFKADRVKEICNEELKGESIVIFSRWIKEVFAIADKLNCPCVTGNTLYSERKRLIDEFRKGEFKYLVFQTKTATHGIDLSCVNNAIMCSNYWEYEKRKQITARMNHPNRTVPSLFIDIITKDTIEEKVYEALEQKRINARFYLQRLRIKRK